MTRNQIGQVDVDTQPSTSPNLARTFPVAPGAGRNKFGFALSSPGSYTWAGIYNTHFWVDPERKIAVFP